MYNIIYTVCTVCTIFTICTVCPVCTVCTICTDRRLCTICTCVLITWCLVCIHMHPYASACVHMHPSRIRMPQVPQYASFTNPNINIQSYFDENIKKSWKFSKSPHPHRDQERQIDTDPSKHSKSAKPRQKKTQRTDVLCIGCYINCLLIAYSPVLALCGAAHLQFQNRQQLVDASLGRSQEAAEAHRRSRLLRWRLVSDRRQRQGHAGNRR